jgi:two-component system, LytTR family, sensor kinase
MRSGEQPTSRTKTIQYPRFRVLFVVWTLLGLYSYARFSLLANSAPHLVLPDLCYWLSCYYTWLLLTPLIFRLERRFPLGRRQWAKHAAVLAVAGLPLAYLAIVVDWLLSALVHRAFHDGNITVWFRWWFPLSDFVIPTAIYWSTLGASFLIRHFIEAQAKERLAAQLALEKSQLESSLRRAELETLRMRLNPHFLFNCLQSVSTLAQQDPRMASQVLAKLGDLLRVYLRPDYQAELPLQEEIALTKAYTSIEQMRYGARLTVWFDIAPETERALVPSLLLQPLVENAIKHGLRGKTKSGEIWIRSSNQTNELLLTVSDNGNGLAKQVRSDLQFGIGLGSTQERLTRLYGEQHELTIYGLPEGGTEVRVVLPLTYREKTTPERVRDERPATADC